MGTTVSTLSPPLSSGQGPTEEDTVAAISTVSSVRWLPSSKDPALERLPRLPRHPARAIIRSKGSAGTETPQSKEDATFHSKAFTEAESGLTPPPGAILRPHSANNRTSAPRSSSADGSFARPSSESSQTSGGVALATAGPSIPTIDSRAVAAALASPEDRIRRFMHEGITEASRLRDNLNEFVNHEAFMMGRTRDWNDEVVNHTPQTYCNQNPEQARSMFEQIAGNENRSRSARLASLWNLVKVDEQEQRDHLPALQRAYAEISNARSNPDQPASVTAAKMLGAYDAVSNAPPAADQPSRVTTAKIFAQVMRDQWHGMSDEEKRELAGAVIDQLNTNSVFLQVAYPEFRNTVLKDFVLDQTAPREISARIRAALAKAQINEQTYEPPKEAGSRAITRLDGYATAALGDVLAHQWKRARANRAEVFAGPASKTRSGMEVNHADANLAAAMQQHFGSAFQVPHLTRRARSSLIVRAYDVFFDGSGADKDNIAKTVFSALENVSNPDRWKYLYDWPDHRRPTAASLFSNFAATAMCTHHLLTLDEDTPYSRFIDDICSAVTAFRGLREKTPVKEGIHYSDDEKLLLRDLATVADSMEAEFGSKIFLSPRNQMHIW